MFASNSPYSSFFTSGLLFHSILDGSRRGSLPTSRPFTQPEYRSFLSLDLAESQSMRSASLKRKAPPSPPPLRLRLSRDSLSLRSIPSPKPAPSTTLPELPLSSAPPRLPSLIPIPALELSLPSLTISRTPAPLTAIRRISVATKATSSSVSTRVRRSNRSEALARLEGRSTRRPPPPLPHLAQHQHRNFMNMSDEGDLDDDSDLDSPDFPHYTFPNPLLEPEDVVLPTPSFLQPSKSAPLPSRNDSLLLPSHKTELPSSKDWLPFKSFIDLRNDDDSSSWAWKSFIDVADVS